MKAEDRLAERHGGPKNAGRPLVLGGKVKWEEMGTTPKDMDFNESKSDAARDICSAFGVPHVLVVEGESTYNNRAMAQLELWEDAILPLVDVMLDSLNTWLTPQYEEGLTLGVDLDEIPALEPRRESKRKNVKEMYDGGLLTRNESRLALQYDDWPDDEVADVDGQILSALVDAANTVGLDPLVRYMKSVNLVDPSATDEEILRRAMDHLDAMRMEEPDDPPVPGDSGGPREDA